MKQFNRKYFLGVIAIVGLIWWLCCLPATLFDAPYSRVVYSAEGELLSARIAADGQWRFPQEDSLDEKYVTAVKLFEDEYFDWHPGVNPVSIFRAFRQNWKAGKTVSGASTLTMQTVRLMRGKKRRRVLEKLIEASWATRLELTYSKAEILQLYAAHAPFGGNVVGFSAAGWRYYGRPPTHLSWAEAAALAVLPNAPGVIYPGRSPDEFLRKRNALLDKLKDRGYLDATALVLAKAERLPGKPHALPNHAPHFTEAIAQAGSGTGQSSLHASLQKVLIQAIDRHHERHHSNGIHNAAILVLDVKSGEPIAYVGNTTCASRGSGIDVDLVQARRSSGSLLKPFLYAALLDDGKISPRTLLPDIPTLIAGYSPKNFDLSYDGAVPAEEALTRSLNVPHVRLLQNYGVEPFLFQLREVGFSSLDRSADNYGLSLILGGGEVTLLEVVQAYRRLALRAEYSEIQEFKRLDAGGFSEVWTSGLESGGAAGFQDFGSSDFRSGKWRRSCISRFRKFGLPVLAIDNHFDEKISEVRTSGLESGGVAGFQRFGSSDFRSGKWRHSWISRFRKFGLPVLAIDNQFEEKISEVRTSGLESGGAAGFQQFGSSDFRSGKWRRSWISRFRKFGLPVLAIDNQFEEKISEVRTSGFPYSQSASFLTLDALTNLKRPGDLAAWRSFSGSRKVAWKTGTSFGFRDAWAVGVTPEYVVAVWTGNADGEGRPGLTGASVAAPLLFEVFDELPSTTWFKMPVSEMSEVFLCTTSGLQATAACGQIDTVLLTAKAQRLGVCPYHAVAYVNSDGDRIDAGCGSLSAATEVSLFTLPPAWAWYYRKTHPNYGPHPEWKVGCGNESGDLMSLVYPRGGRQLHLPRDLSGKRKPVVFEVAHAELGRTLHWYLDDDYLGSTERHHQQSLTPSLGAHKLLVVDDLGRELGWGFDVVEG